MTHHPTTWSTPHGTALLRRIHLRQALRGRPFTLVPLSRVLGRLARVRRVQEAGLLARATSCTAAPGEVPARPRSRRPVSASLLVLALGSLGVTLAKPVKLTLPAFLEALKLPGGAVIPEKLTTAHILVPRDLPPTVYDPAREYVRWGDLTGDFTEVAVWRTTTGRALVGLNSIRPPVENCGDYPCGSVLEWVAHDGTRFTDPPMTALNVQYTCNEPLNSFLTDLPLSARDRATVVSRMNNYRPRLTDPRSAVTQCFLPRTGTTITVSVATRSKVRPARTAAMPLLYFHFDPVRGTFTPRAQP